MEIKYCVTFVLICCFLASFAQQDSLLLPEVQITAQPYSPYTVGTTVVKLEQSAQNLDGGMQMLPSVNFKTYGHYGLASISLRGTSAAHTQINWNGMAVNSPTLGQADLSTHPIFLQDDVSVQYGNSGALVGSGAIGGAVISNFTQPTFNRASSLMFTQGVGSFGHLFTGLKASYGTEKWSGKSKLYRRSIRNNFPYPEKGTDNILKQQNAGLLAYGMEQQFHLRLSDATTLSTVGYYHKNDREIQPPISTNGNDETLKDDDARFLGKLSYRNKSGDWSLSSGYVHTRQIYREQDTIYTNQYFNGVNWDRPVGRNMTMRAGVVHYFFTAEAKSYSSRASENRTELYYSLRYRLTRNWEAGVNLRQALYDGDFAPFTPSFGQAYTINLPKSKLKLKSNISTGYRIPTLNDRYWAPGGNPALLPEQSVSTEVGKIWTRQQKNTRWQWESNWYRKKISQWILWIPSEEGYWSPENVQEVLVNGVETSGNLVTKIGKYTLELTGNYALVQSIIKKDISDEFVNRLLPYTAMHMANFIAALRFWGFNSGLSASYTGKRYTEKSNDAFQALPAYLLLGTSVEKNFRIRKCQFVGGVEINNMLNTYYEQFKNHAMPGRNYHFKISIII